MLQHVVELLLRLPSPHGAPEHQLPGRYSTAGRWLILPLGVASLWPAAPGKGLRLEDGLQHAQSVSTALERAACWTLLCSAPSC